MKDAMKLTDHDLPDWRVLDERLSSRFVTGDWATGMEFLNAVSNLAENAGHHPDVSLHFGHVDISLLSHDVGELTQRDVLLAQRISSVATDLGVAATPEARSSVAIALDVADREAVAPFWAAVLTGDAEARDGDDIVDPSTGNLALWLQHTDAHDVPRQRFHIDVWVAWDKAQERIDAAVAAGGKVIDDSREPAYVVLEDPEGNKACICTALGRGWQLGES